jgi:hypothetical protein
LEKKFNVFDVEIEIEDREGVAEKGEQRGLASLHRCEVEVR